VHAIARRALPTDSANLQPHISTDTTTWASTLESIKPPPAVFFSALGTTKAQAGSFEKQREIDYDLNLAMARAAKAAGTEVYVLISSASVSKSSPFPYTRMKAELEEAVSKLGFKYVVLVKPGLLLGDRQDSRPAEFVFRKIAGIMGAVGGTRAKDFWAQDGDVIARAAVRAGWECVEGKRAEGVSEVGMGDIVRLGRTEWQGNSW
jgi:hypothetical protein